MKKTRNWQVRSCFQCPVHSLCPPLSISSPPAIVSTLFDVGFEGRKKCPFLKYKDLLAIGRVGSQKVPLYVCFLMKIQMVKFCQKPKRDKSIPLTPPVPNKVSEGGILITQKIQDLSGFNFKVQCPCLGKTCWSILANAVSFLNWFCTMFLISSFNNCVLLFSGFQKWPIWGIRVSVSLIKQSLAIMIW